MPKFLFQFLLLLILFSWVKVYAQETDSILLSKRNRVYALVLQIRKASSNDQWQTAVDSAQNAIAIDSTFYSRFISWESIGVCRFKLKHYQGAINDLAHFTIRRNEELWVMRAYVEFKVRAHVALGQIVQAAQTFELFDQNYGPKSNGFQQAAIFYKAAGNKTKFNQLIALAAARSKQNLDSINATSPGSANAMDYAELLIIAGKTTKAAEVLKQDSAKYTDMQLVIKKYLLAVTDELKDNSSFEALKSQLTEFVSHRFRSNIWDFNMFDRWLTYSDLPTTKQQELLALQNIVEFKYQ